MLSRKSIDLLHFLLKEKRNIPLRELSEHFEVSERSIRYEIDKIQKELSEKDGFEFIISKGECFVDNYTTLENILTIADKIISFLQKREKYIYCWRYVLRERLIKM